MSNKPNAKCQMQNVEVGNLILNSRVSLAPMAGITDYVLRSLVRKHSKTCLLTTEMISSEALINEMKCKKRDLFATNNLILRDKDHSPIAYQLTGHKPQLIADAAKILEKYADIIDINMGCPVNKVVKGQDGCALMRNLQLAADIIKAVKNSVDLPVSVKFRLGYSADELNFVEFGVKMQEAGADMITIHGRTRNQMYSGKADWEKIKELKHNVDIPVFANGDIISIETAADCLHQSTADGIAIGRGVLGDVTLISRIEHYLQTGEILPPPTLKEKIEILKTHLDEEIKLRGEDIGIKFIRKFYPYYINGIKNAAKYRAELVLENDYDKIIEKLEIIKQTCHPEFISGFDQCTTLERC
jgi:tRNA-dihydrouridine synthase B